MYSHLSPFPLQGEGIMCSHLSPSPSRKGIGLPALLHPDYFDLLLPPGRGKAGMGVVLYA